MLILFGIISFVMQMVVGFLKREQYADKTGDPWGGRTLEWATSSPPPAYNFAFTPVVHNHDAWWDMKGHGYKRPLNGFKPIHMPRNTASGVVISVLSMTCGFALIWHMWLIAGVAFATLVLGSIVHTFNLKRDFHIPADEVARQLRHRVNASTSGEINDAGAVLALAFPDRIARMDPAQRLRYQLSNGRGARLHENSSLAGEPWLAVAELRLEERDSLIRRAAR